MSTGCRLMLCALAAAVMPQVASAQAAKLAPAPGAAPSAVTAGASAAIPAGGTTVTGDAKAGAQKTAMCAGCHGIEGWRTAFPEVYKVPRIGGQHEAYLVKAMQAYRSGERSHPSMRAIAEPLTDQDIANLAAYYAQPRGRAPAKQGN